MVDYYKKYIKYKIKYNILKMHIGGGAHSIPKPLIKLLNVLKYGTEEIPFIGEAEAIISTIISTSNMFVSTMNLINDSQIKTFLEIDFNNGPKGVLEQFNDIWDDIDDDNINSLCNDFPDIYSAIETFICDWISIIPEVGPATALIIQNTKLLTFNNFASIYKRLPKKIKKIFQHPQILHNIIFNFEKNVKNTILGKHKRGGTILGSAFEYGTDAMGGIVKESASIVSAPIIGTLRVLGLDKKAVKIVYHYFNKVLNPALRISIKALKIFIPLFFALLLVRQKCDL
jgi:hypothetical protein